MSPPSPQRYASRGRQLGVDETVLSRAVGAIKRIRKSDPRLTPVFTLRHLAALANESYPALRQIVARGFSNPYRIIYLKKRVPGRSTRRMICIPRRPLLRIQRWIVNHILRFTTAHDASYAFHPECRPIDAIEQHLNSEWLLKVDLQDFFHSISESDVCRIFSELGYSRLLSFELARIVTIECDRKWPRSGVETRWTVIPQYQNPDEGMLPQGAPTSPMLSNLAFHEVDVRLAAIASAHGFRYSRYADDLAFSSKAGNGSTGKTLSDVKQLKRLVLDELNAASFVPNKWKTVIRGPGTRRIVLGVLVDGPTARLPHEFKDMEPMHFKSGRIQVICKVTEIRCKRFLEKSDFGQKLCQNFRFGRYWTAPHCDRERLSFSWRPLCFFGRKDLP